jgi:uncharacterized protein
VSGPAVGRGPVVAFVALTFAISWGAWGAVVVRGGSYLDGLNLVLFLVGGFGPAIAALLMRLAIDRHAPPPILGIVRRPWWVWAPTAAMLGAGPLLVGVLAGLPFGEGPIASVTTDTISGAGGLLAALAVMVIAGPLSEEPGWRGYAHPRIRHGAGRLATTLVLAPIWVAWHLPLFLIDGTSQHSTGLWTLGFAFFVLSCFPQTYLLGHAYEQGGVAAAVLLHFALNATSVLLQVSQAVENAVALTVVVGAAVLVESRERRNSVPAQHPATVAPIPPHVLRPPPRSW